jgi:hypothetical protein
MKRINYNPKMEINKIELRGDCKNTRANKNFKLLFSRKGLGRQYTVISVN